MHGVTMKITNISLMVSSIILVDSNIQAAYEISDGTEEVPLSPCAL